MITGAAAPAAPRTSHQTRGPSSCFRFIHKEQMFPSPRPGLRVRREGLCRHERQVHRETGHAVSVTTSLHH